MATSGVVNDQIVIQRDSHLVGGLELCAPSIGMEVLVKERAMEALDNAVGLQWQCTQLNN
jgi:hypothetical protein